MATFPKDNKVDFAHLEQSEGLRIRYEKRYEE